MRSRSNAGAYSLCALVAASAAGTVLAGTAPLRLRPELAWSSPSLAHPFGSGEAGVDLLTVATGAELRAIALAVAVALSGWVVGVPLGAAAALARGGFERATARACDLVQAFPSFIFALAVLGASRNPTRLLVGVVFALTAWAPFARLSLAQGRALRDASFVEAAVALGRSPAAVLVKHVVPSLMRVAAVQLGSSAAAMVVSEAGLTFMGFGPRDGLSLGGMLDQGVASMLVAPHVLVVGTICVLVPSAALLAAGRWFESPF